MSKSEAKEAGKTLGPGGVTVVPMGTSYDIDRAVQIWHGPPKTGKSSTAAALGVVGKEYGLDVHPFFLHFEPGTGGFECSGSCMKCSVCDGTGKIGKTKCSRCGGVGVERKVVTSVDEAEEWLDWFAASKDYNIGVIDTMDRFYQTIVDDVCAQLGVPGPHATDHGLAWSLAYDTMRRLLAIPIEANKGLILIMHVYMLEKRVKGGTVQVASFNVPGKARQFLAALANQILYFDITPNEKEDTDKYVIFAKPQAGIEAGDHWGLFPAELDRGKNAEEAAEAILTSFGYLEEEKEKR